MNRTLVQTLGAAIALAGCDGNAAPTGHAKAGPEGTDELARTTAELKALVSELTPTTPRRARGAGNQLTFAIKGTDSPGANGTLSVTIDGHTYKMTPAVLAAIVGTTRSQVVYDREVFSVTYFIEKPTTEILTNMYGDVPGFDRTWDLTKQLDWVDRQAQLNGSLAPP